MAGQAPPTGEAISNSELAKRSPPSLKAKPYGRSKRAALTLVPFANDDVRVVHPSCARRPHPLGRPGTGPGGRYGRIHWRSSGGLGHRRRDRRSTPNPPRVPHRHRRPHDTSENTVASRKQKSNDNRRTCDARSFTDRHQLHCTQPDRLTTRLLRPAEKPRARACPGSRAPALSGHEGPAVKTRAPDERSETGGCASGLYGGE